MQGKVQLQADGDCSHKGSTIVETIQNNGHAAGKDRQQKAFIGSSSGAEQFLTHTRHRHESAARGTLP